MPARPSGPPLAWALLLLAGAAALAAAPPARAEPRREGIGTEFLATLRVPTDPFQVVAPDLTIVNVPGDREGFVRGPRVRGRPVAPCGDWVTVLPGGRDLHTDVRCTIRTGDGSLVYAEYRGVLAWNDAARATCAAGGLIRGSDLYFRVQPRFRAGPGRHAWLNGVAAVGEMTALKCGKGSYTEYDIYLLE